MDDYRRNTRMAKERVNVYVSINRQHFTIRDLNNNEMNWRAEIVTHAHGITDKT